MANTSKATISRTPHKVRLINFSDTITEGYVFLAYGQRISDLLNDDRDFLPVETEAGEVRVIAKRSIMEIELLETPKKRVDDSAGEIVALVSGNAYDILGAPQDADDAMVRAIYLDKIASVKPEHVAKITKNPDLRRAAEQLTDRYAAAYDAITQTRQIEAIAAAMKAAQPKRRRFGDA